MECTLFGQYVDMLNPFLASRKDQHVVIVLQYYKVKTFQGMSLSPIITFLEIYRKLLIYFCRKRLSSKLYELYEDNI